MQRIFYKENINPYAYYPFDGDALDYSGNGRHIVAGVQPQFSVGYNGKQALMGGSYLQKIGLQPPFQLDDSWKSFTFIMRFLVSAYPASHYNNLFDTDGYAGNSQDNDWGIIIRSDHQWSAWAAKMFGVDVLNVSSRELPFSAIPIDTWHTIALSYSYATKTAKLYLDGSIFTSKSNITAKYNTGAAHSPFEIASSTDWFLTRYLNGKIQDFAIYNKALRDSQVVEIMNLI